MMYLFKRNKYRSCICNVRFYLTVFENVSLAGKQEMSTADLKSELGQEQSEGDCEALKQHAAGYLPKRVIFNKNCNLTFQKY